MQWKDAAHHSARWAFIGTMQKEINDVLQGLLENPPPSDNPHSIIVVGDDQDAVTDAKQLIDCQSGFKVSCT